MTLLKYSNFRPATPANLVGKCETDDSRSDSIADDPKNGHTKFIIRRVQKTNDEDTCTWKIASASETESDSDLEVISPSEIGKIPEVDSIIDIEPDEESNESDIKIAPSFKASGESGFQKFIDMFLWDADKIKTPKEAESLGNSLVDQINKSKKPNLKTVQTVKLKRSCVFYNGKWLRKLRPVTKVKKRRKIESNKSVQIHKQTKEQATQVDMRCECNSKMTNVIFETIYPPTFIDFV